MTFAPATEKQVEYIYGLIAKKVVPGDVLTRIDDIEDGLLSKADASQFITLLKDLPYREVRRPAVQASPSVTTPDEGLYTVHDEQSHVTFRVRRASWAQGRTVISYLTAVNGRQTYRGFGFLSERGLQVWDSARDAHKAIHAAQWLIGSAQRHSYARQTFLNLAEAHALSSGTCLSCLKTLTVPASIYRGLGPDCARRLGVA